MRQSLQVFALLLAWAPAGAASAENVFESDSGIDGPPYEEIFQATGELATLHPGWATVSDYGSTPRGRPLRLVKIQNPNALGRRAGDLRPAVVISGSTHGDEYLNIEDRLAPWFLANRETSPGLMRFLAQGGLIYVIPILNPDGYDADQRANSNGVDLNRDFDLIPTGDRKFHEVETRLLAEWLEQDLAVSGAQIRLSVDYHCCAGALLFPWSYSDNALPPDLQRGHVDIAHLMQQHIDSSYIFGNTSAVLGYYAFGTSKDYYHAKYGALAFTFEGQYGREHTKFPQHTVWWDHVLGSLR